MQNLMKWKIYKLVQRTSKPWREKSILIFYTYLLKKKIFNFIHFGKNIHILDICKTSLFLYCIRSESKMEREYDFYIPVISYICILPIRDLFYSLLQAQIHVPFSVQIFKFKYLREIFYGIC